MGLYLCVYDRDKSEEIEGVEVGSYEDFKYFRDTISQALEGKIRGSRFPLLMNHHDSDGLWDVSESIELQKEIKVIMKEAAEKPAVPYSADWQKQVAKTVGHESKTLYDSFIDVDGEPLLERLADLCSISEEHKLPILFQ